MTLYCSLDFAQQNINAEETADTAAERARLFQLIRIVSRRIDNLFASRYPVFAPTIATRKVRVSPDRVNSYDNTLRLDGSLLALSGVSVGNTALTVGTNVSGWSDVDMPPYPYLRLTNCDSRGWYYADCADCGSPLFATISGTWGIHRDYPNAWQSVDALAAGINASVTTLTVADVDGADLYGWTPRISPGNLLKIDDEFLEVTATNTTTNAVTVRRGVNGSTAAAHDNGKAVAVWQVEEPIRHATARQAGLLYERRGAYTTTEITAAGAEIRYPTDLLNELRGVVQGYVYGM